MRSLRALGRLARALLLALQGWWLIRRHFPLWDQPRRNATVQDWARRMLGVLGIPLQVHGQPPVQGPVLLVANHMSWLDILVLHAARHCRFVSKSDVKHWPLVGTLATGGGTLYIEREKRRDAMRVVHHMAESLAAGEIVAVFPEGTTGDGGVLLPFHGNLIQAAIAVHVPVQPVGLRFDDAVTGAASRGPLYLGDDTLVGSLWRTLAGPPFVAVVCFGEPQLARGRDRRQWAQDLREDVEQLRQRRAGHSGHSRAGGDPGLLPSGSPRSGELQRPGFPPARE